MLKLMVKKIFSIYTISFFVYLGLCWQMIKQTAFIVNGWNRVKPLEKAKKKKYCWKTFQIILT